MNMAPEGTFKTFKTSFAAAAERVLASASASYERALADQQRDIAQAAATKGHLGDGYWKPAHAARLRYLAALAVIEAVNEG
ncbi:MAG: hypothetical protein M9955_19690 [Rhizobiaceae bacterium]|nr:hypothetical protein [Rhizobiaceae bacterium]